MLNEVMNVIKYISILQFVFKFIYSSIAVSRLEWNLIFQSFLFVYDVIFYRSCIVYTILS